MIDKNLIVFVLSAPENKVYISNLGEPFYCDVDVCVGDNYVYDLRNERIDDRWRWHKPNKKFDGNLIKVVLKKNVPTTVITEDDPLGEELWETYEILMEKSWKVD